jgi:hypothetical protein
MTEEEFKSWSEQLQVDIGGTVAILILAKFNLLKPSVFILNGDQRRIVAMVAAMMKESPDFRNIVGAGVDLYRKYPDPFPEN